VKVLGQVIVLCLAIAALQAFASIIVLVLVALLFAGLLFRTKETVGLLLLGLLLSIGQVYPLVLLALLFALLGATLIGVGRKVPSAGLPQEDTD